MAIERSIRINVETGRAKAELRSFQNSLVSADKVGGALKNTLLGLVAGVSLNQVIGQLTRFEDEMAGVRAVTGATTKQFELLNKQARLLGATTTFGAEQAAGAQRFLAQAGFEVNEILSATPGILNLAKAGQLELAEAADIASNVLSGLRLEVSELNRVNDVLVKSANSANTNVRQLGDAFAYAAPFAAAAGVSLEETAAFIGAVGDAGIQAGRAGTDFVGFIRQTALVLPEAAKALAAYGLSSEDVNISTRGLIPVLKTLSDAGLSLADAFKIFGTEAGDSAQIALSSVGKIEALTDSFKNAEGAASTAAAIMGDTLGASIKGLTSAISEAVLQSGDGGLGGALRGLATTAAGVVQSYNGLLDAFVEANGLTEGQVTAINAASEAAELLAVVFGAKVVGALAASGLATTKNIQVTLAHSAALKQNSIIDLDAAKIKARGSALEVSQAKARLDHAIIIQRQTGSVVLANAAWTNLAKTNQANIAAQNALTAAMVRNQAATSRSAALTRGLGSAMALVGGPVGAAALATFGVFKLADAISKYRAEVRATTARTDELTESFKDLSRAQIENEIQNATLALAEIRREQEQYSITTKEASNAIASQNTLLGGLAGQMAKGAAATERNTEKRIENNAALKAAEERLAALIDLQDKENKVTDSGTDIIATQLANYNKLKAEYDEVTAATQRYEQAISIINAKQLSNEQRTDLLNEATKKYKSELAKIGAQAKKTQDAFDRQHRSFSDLRGEFEETSKIAFEYGELMKEIANSTATDAEKKELQSLAYRKLQEDIDGATTTGQEFLAQFDQIAAAEVQRTESLKSLEKVQASSAEKQKLAAEIQRQYNKDIDAATPSLIRLNAQFSAVDAATVAYVDTLKELDEAERKGLDVTNLRTSALKAYKKAAEEARKQDILNTETNKTFFGAFAQGLNDTAQTAESSFDKIREFGRETVDNLSDAFSEFVTTGEFDFRNFASNIIAELLRIETKARILEGIELFKGERKEGGGFLESVAGAIGGVFGGEDKDGGGGIASFFGFGGGDKTSTGGGEEEPLRLGGLFDGSGGDSGFGQESAEMFGETWTNTLDDVGGQFDEVFGNALAQSDQLGSSTESAAASIGTSLVGSLIKMGAQALINATVGTATTAALTTAGTAAASTLAAAWAPAAAAVSLATLGTNAVPAATGITTTYALTSTLSAASTAGGGGGTFARGGVELSDLSGSVISTPTKFAAGGSFNNQLGEAGAEAILPLQKTAGGELGVKATMEGMQMQQQAPQVNVPVRVVNVARDPEDFLSSSEGEKVIVNIMNRNKGVFSA